MGLCNSKATPEPDLSSSSEELKEPSIPTSNPPPNGENNVQQQQQQQEEKDKEKEKEKEQKVEPEVGKFSPFFPFYSPSPAHSLLSKKSPAPSGNSTPRRFFKRPFPPPSPAKHIRALLARRHGSVKPNEASIPEGSETAVNAGAGLDKSFGFSKNFANKYELGEGIGRGHFGYTCAAKFKKGEFKDQQVAVKVIPKIKMTTAIAIEDVRREVKILRALTGHNNLVRFYDACEDNENVYIVME